MKTSESTANIFEAIYKARPSFKPAVKNSKNPHFKSTYADLSSVMDAVEGALYKQGVQIFHSPEPSESAEARVTTRLQHTSGEYIESTISVPVNKQDAQGYGSALTYARRYSLLLMLALLTEDDDGNAAAKAAPVITADQAATILALIEETGSDEAGFCTYLKVGSVEEIPASLYKKAVDALQKKRK